MTELGCESKEGESESAQDEERRETKKKTVLWGEYMHGGRSKTVIHHE